MLILKLTFRFLADNAFSTLIYRLVKKVEESICLASKALFRDRKELSTIYL